jgi:hypothetical protein
MFASRQMRTFTPRPAASRSAAMMAVSVSTYAAMSICFAAWWIKPTSIVSKSSPGA